MTAKKKKKVAVRASAAERYPNNINDALLDAELSKNKLAQMIDVERPYISRLASGHYLPSVAMALVIARALGTTVEAIWGDLKFEDCRRR